MSKRAEDIHAVSVPYGKSLTEGNNNFFPIISKYVINQDLATQERHGLLDCKLSIEVLFYEKDSSTKKCEDFLADVQKLINDKYSKRDTGF